MCWSFAEIIRFSFYAIKELEISVYTSFIGRIVATIRYNLFIVNYPLGVSGELICVYQAWQVMDAMVAKGEKVPFSLEMPNALNFSFDFLFFVKCVPIFYLPGLPMLYMHMVK